MTVLLLVHILVNHEALCGVGWVGVGGGEVQFRSINNERKKEKRNKHALLKA
jgi:hypothetical protein